MSVAQDPPENPHPAAPDPGAGRPAEAHPVDPLRPAHDRLLFLKARSALASLCGCTESQAAQALLATAVRHGVTARDVGERFLSTTLDADLRRGAGAGGDAERIVSSLLEAASSASASDQARRRTGRDARPDLPWRGASPGGRTGPAGPGNPRRFRAWGLAVEGDVDVTSGPTLRDAVERLDWQEPGAGHAGDALLLDLSAVTFVDASGTRALGGIHDFVTARGVRLHVTPPANPGAHRLVRFAVRVGWLAPAFAPGEPVQPAIGDPGRPARQPFRRELG